MSTNIDHSIAIGHRDGKAIGLLATLESLGLPDRSLGSLTYCHSISDGTITITDNQDARVMVLGNLAKGLLDCCDRGLPIYVLKPNGEDIELVITPCDPENRSE